MAKSKKKGVKHQPKWVPPLLTSLMMKIQSLTLQCQEISHFLLERYKQRERDCHILRCKANLCLLFVESSWRSRPLPTWYLLATLLWCDINKVLCKCESHVFIVSAARPLSCLDFRILLGCLCCWHGSHSWWWLAGVLTKSFYLTLQNHWQQHTQLVFNSKRVTALEALLLRSNCNSINSPYSKMHLYNSFQHHSEATNKCHLC